MKDFLIKANSVVEKSQTYFSSLALFVMMWLIFVMVFFRYVLNNSIVWGEEILRYINMWAILVGSGLTIREDGHICIDVVQSLLKNAKAKAVMYIITRGIAVFFIISMIPASIDLITKSAGGHSASLTWLPIAVVYAAYPVGAISMTLSYLYQVPQKVLQIIREGDTK